MFLFRALRRPGDLFEGLDVWKNTKYRELRGTYPVLFLSFADVKENSFTEAGAKICHAIETMYNQYEEAYVNGYREGMTAFIRGLFNSTFKTNPWLERAVMAGITRISMESVFSDLNNLKVVTAASSSYQDSFVFTEKEVFMAPKGYGLSGSQHEKMPYLCGFQGIFAAVQFFDAWNIGGNLRNKQ